MNILFLTHDKRECGVYQWGLQAFNALKKYGSNNYIYQELSNIEQYNSIINNGYDFVIFNYHPLTLGWLRNSIINLKIKKLGTLHDTSQMSHGIFNIELVLDPNFKDTNNRKGLPRCVLDYESKKIFNNYEIPVIGSFGFGFAEKGWDNLIKKVNDEFDEAVIKLNIPFNPIVDPGGTRLALRMAATCKSIKIKPNIDLQITHDFMDTKDLLDWLDSNTINAFYYDQSRSNGISSVTDWALAVKKPLGVSSANMFRHLNTIEPSICLDKTSFKSILDNYPEPLNRLWKFWSEESFAFRFENIIKNTI